MEFLENIVYDRDIYTVNNLPKRVIYKTYSFVVKLIGKYTRVIFLTKSKNIFVRKKHLRYGIVRNE